MARRRTEDTPPARNRPRDEAADAAQTRAFEEDPHWYKDAVIYQAHVRAFADSNGDGIGDFRGLTGKLDYLRDLGVTAIWLLPFYPSPLRDDGYDIADYTGLHPDYGTVADFRVFLREAHRRGLRVITELVLNHTSDQHPWFQRARRAAPGSSARDFYVWSDTPDRYSGTRIIFKDFEHSNWSWDPVAKAYYWHRFYSHQPDLNFENPAVKRAVFQAMEFWLSMGVDGLRLDAVPYLFEREGTSCENLPETHQMLRELRRKVDSRYRDRMLLAEANQWPEDAVAYFGDGDECHMAFHFPVMPRMFMALRMEDRYPILDILAQTPPIPDPCQWAVFLRNHDELTLEMVTDEERDYMYRVYANDPRARVNLGIRRRLAPLLGNDRRRIELMNGLLFSLPGTPILYYGDEIGMGDNIYLGDRNGVRTPMQWSSDRNAGFSRANAQRLYLPVIIDPDFHHEALNVEAQQNNPTSLLWWMRRLIGLRKRFKAFGRGTMEFLEPENRKVLAFLRRFDGELLLVVANLSRHAQYVELDLSEFKGMSPVELFGGTRFPAIGDLTYLLTLAPHAFHWFSLEAPAAGEGDTAPAGPQAAVPRIRVKGGWADLFRREDAAPLMRVLPAWLRTRRWFGGKARRIESVELLDAVFLGEPPLSAWLSLVRVEYAEGDPDTYLLPIGFARGEEARSIEEKQAGEVIARLSTSEGDGVVTGALHEDTVRAALLDTIESRRRLKGLSGEIRATRTRAFRTLRGPSDGELPSETLRAEQSNTSILYGERLLLKLFRRVEGGLNPDLEIGRYLTERTSFQHVPLVAGALEYHSERGEPMTLAILQAFVPNEGDSWKFTLDVLSRYFERAASRAGETPEPTPGDRGFIDLARAELPAAAREQIGVYLESARLLGHRTAEMHLALASAPDDPSFGPEAFTPMYQRSLYQSMRNELVETMGLLQRRLRSLEPGTQAAARRVIGLEEAILGRYALVRRGKIAALRTRIHGDYHLGQVLSTGRDFVIIDFEGEPAQSLSARRIKRSPLRDVAGMLRSFDYAAHTAFRRFTEAGIVPAGEIARLVPWANLWVIWVSSSFLRSYLEHAAPGGFLPQTEEDLRSLLDAYVLEKAVYEIRYELNNRPGWAGVPMAGLLHIMRAEE